MISKHKLPLLTCLLLGLALTATAQNKPVTGTVTEAGSGETLPGVNIILKGTSTGTSTNAQGTFKLKVPSLQDTLVFSFIGYQTQTVPIDNRSEINIELQSQALQGEELVVVGYGTQQKKDLTGAVDIVDSEEIQSRQATTVAEAMQGMATGISVRGGGQPGAEADIEIRGLKNLSDSDPLYVIDGMIANANRDFNPNDIESIQVLKDASAAAIYGSRAANGVIIITTKNGQGGPMKVAFSAKSSLQVTPRYDLAGTEEFARLNNMAYDNAGVPRQDLNMSVHTNWQDQAFRVGNIQDYNLSVSGGNENGTYLVSGNYFGNKGTAISSDFDRFSLRVNSQGSKGIFSFGENAAITNAKSNDLFDNQGISGNPYADVVRMLPTIPVYDENNPGGYGYGDEDRARTFGTNPVAVANLVNINNENFRIRGNLWSELDLFPFLNYRLNLGYETSNDHFINFREEGNWTLNQPFDPAINHENRARYQRGLIENTLTFDKDFAKHAVTLVIGQTYQQDNYEQIWGTKRNILQNANGRYYSVLDQGNEPQTGGFSQEAVLLSYLGRLEYNFDDRYLVNATFRRDGTSRLSEDNRWGNFPSISGAWRISQEAFFQVPWISDLKLRASYGTLGSSNIAYWDYLATINTFSTIAIGEDQHIEPGAAQVQLVNDDLKWEILKETNFGIDAGFLDDKLSVTAEYFIAKTEDVLTGVPITLTTGNDGGNPVVNAASLKNKGFEFSATYRGNTPSFNYNATVNLTTVRNEVVSLGFNRNDIFVGNTVTEVGEPVGMWYVLETDGLFQSLEEVNNYTNGDGVVIQPSAQPGDIRFKDNNGDGQITNDDKAVAGSPWPDYEVGLNLGASYKGFQLTMNWFGSFGATVYNGFRSVVDRFDDNTNYRSGVEPWTPENPDTDFPRVVYASTLNSRGDSDRWLEDGSFVRLKHIRLAYTIPRSIVRNIGFSNAQISLSGQNLLTFTKYKGLDPEFNNPNIFLRGFDNFMYPNLKTYSLGLQFEF